MTARELTSMRLATADGAQLHLEGPGTGRPILLLHGLGYASWAATALRDALGDEYALWSLDNRGTGRSTRGSMDMSIEILARDAAAAAQMLDAPLPVIGYSMGGYIAQLLAVAEPGSISRLFLIGTSAGSPITSPVPESTRSVWLEAADTTPEEYARLTMPFSFRRGWPETHGDEYERIIRTRLERPTPPAVWSEQYEACERFLASGYQAKRLSTPTLVLHGDADRVLPVENSRMLARALPNVRYLEIAAGGHLLHIEQPDLVASEIRSFLTSPPPSPDDFPSTRTRRSDHAQH